MEAIINIAILVLIVLWAVNVSKRLNALDGKTFLRGVLAKDKKGKRNG